MEVNHKQIPLEVRKSLTTVGISIKGYHVSLVIGANLLKGADIVTLLHMEFMFVPSCLQKKAEGGHGNNIKRTLVLNRLLKRGHFKWKTILSKILVLLHIHIILS